MKTCPGCGKTIERAAATTSRDACPHCGNQPGQAPLSPKRSPQTSRLAIAGVLLIPGYYLLSLFALSKTPISFSLIVSGAFWAAVVGIAICVLALAKIDKLKGSLRGRGLALLGTILNILVIATFLLPHPCSQSRESARRSACVNNLKHLGLVLNLYAAENKDRFPPIDSTKNNFMFEASLLYPEYLSDTAILACPSDPDCNPEENFRLTSKHSIDGTPKGQVHADCITDMSYGYTGWMITTDKEAKAFFEAYDKMAPENYDKNISVPEGMGNPEIIKPEGMNDPESDVIHRLSMNVDRFLYTDMTWVGSDEVGSSLVPIMWDQISTDITEFSHVPAGQNVLYLDGHVEFYRYDPANTSFPTTLASATMFGGRPREPIQGCEE